MYYVLVGTDYDAFEYRVALAPNDAEVPRARGLSLSIPTLSHSFIRSLAGSG